jgi:hypothetical protein
MEHMGGNRNAYKVLVGTVEGKRPLRRPGHRQKWTGFIWLRIGTNGVLL